jgi:ATP-dependent Clp protease adaptor protein ClpS
MEFVVQVLEKSLRLHRVEATRMMLEIHNKGGVLVATVSVEESRRVAEEVSEAARVGGHPLACRAVSVESPG